MRFLALDTGKIVVIVVVLLFYLRLFMLRGRKLKQERAASVQRLQSRGKGKQAPVPAGTGPSYFRPRYGITSWWIMGPGVLLMLIGLAMNTTSLFPVPIQPYNWVFIALGGVLFIFGIK